MQAKHFVKLSRLSALVAGLALASAATAGTPSFNAQQTFATGSTPRAVASADLNGDGMPDLIVANWTDGTVSVLMNQDSAGASAPNYADQQTFAVGSGPTFVTTADLNGDGKPDLIVINGNSKTVTVLINTTPLNAAQASFAPAQTFAVGNSPEAVAVADINGDGLPDLVVSNYGDYTLSVLLNTTAALATTASFAPQQLVSVSGGPYALQTVDLNGDGSPDVVVTEMDSGMVSVLLNTTAPAPAVSAIVSFAAQQDYQVGGFPISVAVADLDGDGLLDIAVVNEGDNTLSVLFNNGSAGAPGYATQQVIPVGNAPMQVVATDLDGDGKPDLAVMNFVDNDIMVFANSTSPSAGSYSYSSQSIFAVGNSPYAFLATDENGDGKADLITANAMDNTVSVLFNATP